MAVGGQKIVFSAEEADDEVEYNSNLCKAMSQVFKHSIDANQLVDCPEISWKLTMVEIETVRKTHENQGTILGAGKLLEILHKKHDWFPALLTAMDTKELKLTSLKPKFLDLKKNVDDKWLRAHHNARTECQAAVPVANPSLDASLSAFPAPTQSREELARRQRQLPHPSAGMDIDVPLCSAVPATRPDGGAGISSDFELNIPQVGLERDTVMETAPEYTSPSLSAEPSAQDSSKTDQGTTVRQPGEAAGGGEGAEGGGGPDEMYMEASSGSVEEAADSDYEMLGKDPEDDHTYMVLTNIHMERDACPFPEQPSEIPQQEVGEEATPQVLTPQQVQNRRRRQPRTREDHPSLRQAISGDPRKDFDATTVTHELSAMAGWSNRQEERKVIQLIRPHQDTDGYYVIWYWSLAKRPTVCVIHGGRVITFVVHKSSMEPTTYYFNKRQKRCSSLKELLRYHLAQGIQYCPQGGQEVNIRLIHPHTRQHRAGHP